MGCGSGYYLQPEERLIPIRVGKGIWKECNEKLNFI